MSSTSDLILRTSDQIKEFRATRRHARTRFPDKIRREVLSLYENGYSISKLSEDLSLDESMIRGWCGLPNARNSKASVRTIRVLAKVPPSNPKQIVTNFQRCWKIHISVLFFRWEIYLNIGLKQC